MPVRSEYPTRLVAADVGGTTARVALVDAAAGRAPRIVHQQSYACAAFSSLASLLVAFLDSPGARGIDQASIAIPGVLVGDTLVNENLPWPVSLSRTRAESGLHRLEFTNDFEALAHAMPHADRGDALLLTGKPIAPGSGSTLVLGPGTGLGAALRLPASEGSRARVIPSEAGHAALAPGNETELELVRWLLARHAYANNEQALSGPGLLNIYHAACDARGATPTLDKPADVTAAARQGTDPVALAALQVFCGLLGSLTGDLVLTTSAREVCIAGGIPSQIAPFIQHSDFVARFLNKGRLRPVLEPVPVWLLDHGVLGIIGAASWYVEARSADVGRV